MVDFLPKSLEIYLTDKCNLRCSYCFLNKNGEDKLKFSHLKKIIDDFLIFPKLRTINFTGGEPLIRYGLLKRIIQYSLQEIKKKESKVSINIITNVTFLEKEKKNFFEDNPIRLTFSLDGKRQTNDYYRKFKDNKESSVFKKVYKNIKRIKRDNVKVSLVFSSYTVNRLYENIDFLIKEGFLNIDFFPIAYEVWTAEKLKELNFALEKLLKKYSFLNSSYLTKLKNKEFGKDNFQCSKFILSADGNFYFCEKVLMLNSKDRQRYAIGNVNLGIDILLREILLREARLQILKLTERKCFSCPLKRYCFCPIGLYLYCSYFKKDFKDYFKSFCSISKIYISNFLKVVFNKKEVN